jgi:DNA-binding transcriptional regulator GbsR (MarR family)
MCLSDEPQTVKELIVATGKVKSTVSLALTELQQLGAASEVDEGHIRGDVSMTEVAHVLGAQELTSRRRSRHTWERQAYDRWMHRKDTVSGSKG